VVVVSFSPCQKTALILPESCQFISGIPIGKLRDRDAGFSQNERRLNL
jgi:hypothetical protein